MSTLSRYATVVRSYGLSVEHDDKGEIDTPEASFLVFGPDDQVEVTLWSGSYPFVVDHPQGVLGSIEDAARYVVWLLKRETSYADRDQALLDSQPEPCQIDAAHHSDDRIEIYQGSTIPRIVCGYHAMREGLKP